MTQIYTKHGDGGETGLAHGGRVRKDDVRIIAIGEIDELNAWLGLAAMRTRTNPNSRVREFCEIFQKIQEQLFVIGAHIATPIVDMQNKLPQFAERDVRFLECAIDILSEELQTLTHFILPGGSLLSSELHIARALCRRAERAFVACTQTGPQVAVQQKYLNRLSDFLFTAARWVNKIDCAPERLWFTK